VGIVKRVFRDWTDRYLKKYWEPRTVLRYARGFLQGLSARRTGKVLELN
jgi:hypothetical protein